MPLAFRSARFVLVTAAAVTLSACAGGEADARPVAAGAGDAPLAAGAAVTATTTQRVDTAYFAGGCFWCMEPPYEKLDGVRAVISGYTGGTVERPTYKQVSAGTTGHTEAVLVAFEPDRISYERLLDVFWYNIDPLTADAQFCDRGTQYRSGIYPRTPAQRAAAEASRAAIAPKLDGRIVTEIVDATTFWPAEEYHQDYYKKNPVRYRFYRFNCGRDQRLEALWGEAAGVGVMAGATASAKGTR